MQPVTAENGIRYILQIVTDRSAESFHQCLLAYVFGIISAGTEDQQALYREFALEGGYCCVPIRDQVPGSLQYGEDALVSWPRKMDWAMKRNRKGELTLLQFVSNQSLDFGNNVDTNDDENIDKENNVDANRPQVDLLTVGVMSTPSTTNPNAIEILIRPYLRPEELRVILKRSRDFIEVAHDMNLPEISWPTSISEVNIREILFSSQRSSHVRDKVA